MTGGCAHELAKCFNVPVRTCVSVLCRCVIGVDATARVVARSAAAGRPSRPRARTSSSSSAAATSPPHHSSSPSESHCTRIVDTRRCQPRTQPAVALPAHQSHNSTAPSRHSSRRSRRVRLEVRHAEPALETSCRTTGDHTHRNKGEGTITCSRIARSAYSRPMTSAAESSAAARRRRIGSSPDRAADAER